MPPLSPGDERTPPSRRAQISLRWLAGTVLTGCAGCFLLAGALFSAFDRDLHFTESDIDGLLALSSSDPSERKSDRIDAAAAQPIRSVLHDTAVHRVGDKEFIGFRPYVSISTPLAQQITDFASEIPSFDPVAIYAAAGAWEVDRPAEDVPETERQERVRIETSPLAIGFIAFADSSDAALNEVESEVRDTLAYAAAGTLDPAIIEDLLAGGDGGYDIAGELMIGSADAATGDVISGVRNFDLSTIGGAEVRQAMTVLAKRGAPLDVDGSRVVEVTAGRGDTLMTILTSNGATRDEAAEIVRVLAAEYDVVNLQEGQAMTLFMRAEEDGSGRERPIRVSLSGEADELAAPTVAMATTGDFISFQPDLSALALRASVDATATATTGETGQATVFQSLYETALGQDIDRTMVDELIAIFSFDLDFQNRVANGDRLDLFYSLPVENEGEAIDEDAPAVLFASVTTRGETHTFYRFRTPDDGAIDFYDEEGRSAKQFLMRKPLSGGVFRSGFGMRRHPILGYRRMHNGADWAARSGTPIMAAGDGVVTHADWKSGYGRHIVIRHANGYQTTYSHMSGYASGVREGVRVRLGQVIGYVGSSGLSTGAHLHYEVLVNGRFVDPMRIRLPRGRVLEGRMLAEFERERARIDALMARAREATRVARADN
ncbi:MAG: M23 family metallopeptidase [Pseudomonadota bacterium]